MQVIGYRMVNSNYTNTPEGQDFLNYLRKSNESNSPQCHWNCWGSAGAPQYKLCENLPCCWQWWWAQCSGGVRVPPNKCGGLLGPERHPDGTAWSCMERYKEAECKLAIISEVIQWLLYCNIYSVLYITWVIIYQCIYVCIHTYIHIYVYIDIYMCGFGVLFWIQITSAQFDDLTLHSKVIREQNTKAVRMSKKTKYIGLML